PQQRAAAYVRGDEDRRGGDRVGEQRAGEHGGDVQPQQQSEQHARRQMHGRRYEGDEQPERERAGDVAPVERPVNRVLQQQPEWPHEPAVLPYVALAAQRFEQSSRHAEGVMERRAAASARGKRNYLSSATGSLW